MRFRFFTTFMLIMGSSGLFATNYVFLPSNGEWDVASNWSPVGIPAAGDNIFIGLQQTMTISTGTLSVNNITIQGGVLQQNGGTIICSGLLYLRYDTYAVGVTTVYVEGTANLNSATNQFNLLEMKGSSRINANMPVLSFNSALIDGVNPNNLSLKAFISGSADLNVVGNLTMKKGVVDVSGNIQVGGMLDCYGGNFGGASNKTMTVIGICNLLEGDIVINYITFLPQGGCQFTSGNITNAEMGVFKIPSGTTFTDNNNSAAQVNISVGNNGGSMEVAGTYLKHAAATVFIQGLNLLAGGAMTINAGCLMIGANTTLMGNIFVAPTACLITNGGPIVQGGGLIDCAGLFRHSSGSTTLINYSLNTVECNGGTLTLNMPASNIAAFSMSNGAMLKGLTDLTFSANVFIINTSGSGGGGYISNTGNITFLQNLSLSNGGITNTGTVSVNGDFIWAGGLLGSTVTSIMTVSGNTFLQSIPAVSFPDGRRLSKNLVLQGGGSWTVNGLTIENDGVFSIPVAQTFQVSNGGAEYVNCNPCTNNSGVFVQGIFEKNGVGKLNFDAPLHNSGTFNLNSGAIKLNNGKVLNGNINGATGTLLELGGGIATQSSGSMNCASLKVLGGTTTLSGISNNISLCETTGGTLTINSTEINIGTLNMNGGTINGSAVLQISGNVSIDGGGILNNSGAVNVAGTFTWKRGILGPLPGSLMTVSGLSTFAFSGSNIILRKTLSLAGGGTWTQGSFSIGDNGELLIPASATLVKSFASDGSISAVNGSSSGTVKNQGIFRIINSGTTSLSGVILNNSGTLSVESGKLLAGYTTINSGTIKGVGIFELPFPFSSHSNTGVYSPGLSPGTLTHIGPYTNASLHFEMQESGGIVSKDLLNVTGSMTLGGTLNIDYLGGNIPIGTYDIAVCSGTRSGAFATVNYPSICNGNCSIAYTSNKAQLVVSAPLPIELLEVSAEALPQGNVITWRSAQERNVAWHIVERSADGLGAWMEIGRQAGSLYSNSQKTYQIEDRMPLPQAYYRLRSVDVDGREQLSGMVMVQRRETGLQILSVAPSPAQTQFTILFLVAQAGTYHLDVYHSNGRLQQSQLLEVEKGQNEVRLFVSDWPAGIYFLHLKSVENKSDFFRFLKE